MNRLLLLVLVLFASPSFAQQSSNVLTDVPASENTILTERARLKALSVKDLHSRLLGKEYQNAKNGNESIEDIVHVQSGKTITVCLDTTAIAGSFGMLNDIACSSLDFGTASISNNCFTYIAATGVIGRDTLCLELCDVGANCTPFIFPIRVSSAIAPPFFDDFSQSNVVTNAIIWQNSDVFVNKTIGISPPSIGMVTFDGIDEDGRPYGGGHGPSDKLTSTFIDLNAFSPADDVYFSYWVQPKGYGDRPDFKDSLVLEFKDENGAWNTVQSFNGIPLDTPSTRTFPFERHSIQLSDTIYFHDGFQFKFTNYSTNSGAVDNWHVDYISLQQNSSATSSSDDVAFTEIPRSILYNYTAMPWKHFEAAPELLRDSFTVSVYNHSNQSSTPDPDPFFVTKNDVFSNNLPTRQAILDNTQKVLAPNAAASYTTKIDQYSGFQSNLLQDFAGVESLVLNTIQSLATDNEDVAKQDNSRVNRLTVFDDYFAYDDGSAETNIIAEGRGTEIGVQYKAYAADSLKAVAISFINVTGLDLTQELFNLKVYVGSKDADPVLENILLRPILTNSLFDTIQSFTTYALVDPSTNEKIAIPIAAGEDFYIGFQTASKKPIPVGFDRNSPEAADKNWYALSSGWFEFPPSHQGAVMIRPIFGTGSPVTTNTENPIVDVSEVMQVFPNPSRGQLNFISEDLNINSFRYKAYNTLGQIVQQGRLTDQVDFSTLTDGVYYLQLVQENNQKTYNHKFILSK